MRVPKHYVEALELIVETEQYNMDVHRRAKAALGQLRTRNKVCLVKKALYGLRQAGRSW